MTKTDKINFLIAFGQAVQNARESKNWSRDKLAEILGITSRYLQYIEARGQCPSLKVFVDMVLLLNISVDKLFFPDTTELRSLKRRQLDAMLDNMDSKDLHVIFATASALEEGSTSDL